MYLRRAQRKNELTSLALAKKEVEIAGTKKHKIEESWQVFEREHTHCRTKLVVSVTCMLPSWYLVPLDSDMCYHSWEIAVDHPFLDATTAPSPLPLLLVAAS